MFVDIFVSTDSLITRLQGFGTLEGMQIASDLSGFQNLTGLNLNKTVDQPLSSEH